MYGGNGNEPIQCPYQAKNIAPMTTMELVPIEFDVKSLYEDHEQRRRNFVMGKNVTPQLQVGQQIYPYQPQN
jgi:hypothetical protein